MENLTGFSKKISILNQFVSKDWDHRIGFQFLIIRDFLRNVTDRTLPLDLNGLSFCPPMFSLFISKLIKDNNLEFSVPDSLPNYFLKIHLGSGVDPEIIEEWKPYLEAYQRKTYLPLIRFSTQKDTSSAQIRNNLIGQVGQMIRRITGVTPAHFAGISYMLSELSDNIVDHSNHSHGWISFQFYPSEGFIDLCLGDSGDGVLASYQRYSGPKDYRYVTSDSIAIAEMIKGESTKKLDERGFGFHTSREMLIDGMGGSFSFVSGNALLLNYQLISFGVDFPGTLAHLRIPLNSLKSDFSVYNYVE